MTPIKQTILHDPQNGVYGNCFSACLASLLDLPINAVPHFTQMVPSPHSEWMDLINSWLRKFDLAYFEVELTSLQEWTPYLERVGYYVLSGPSPRSANASHAVIARGGAIAFDPHPSEAGLADGYRMAGFLVKRCGA